jgi:hypothetical protein
LKINEGNTMSSEEGTRDEESAAGTDQTNGLAGNLEGDDGGALNPEDHQESLFESVVKHGLEPDDEENQTGETKYSEEGRD